MSRLERYIKNESLLLTGATVALLTKNLYDFLSTYLFIILRTKRDLDNEKVLKEYLKENGYTDLNFKIVTTSAVENNIFNIGDYIIISEDYLEDLTDEELFAALLHEYGHYIKKHSIVNYIRKNSFLLLAFTATSAFGPLYQAILVFIALTLCGNYSLIVMRKQQEYEADNIVSKLGFGIHLASALNKMDRKTSNKLEKVIEILSELIDEHPPIRKRIKKILSDLKYYKYPQYISDEFNDIMKALP